MLDGLLGNSLATQRDLCPPLQNGRFASSARVFAYLKPRTAGSLQAFLFRIAPTDVSTLVYCSGFLALIGVLACALPASLAVRVDPAVALRSE